MTVHHIEGLALGRTRTEVLLVPDRTVRPELLRRFCAPAAMGCGWNVVRVFTTPDGETPDCTTH